VTIRGSPDGAIISCDCQLFGLLETSLRNAVGESTNSDWQGIKCCHARLARDILVIKPMLLVPNDSVSVSLPRYYLNDELLKKGESYVENPVIELPSNKNVFKFSVVDDNGSADLVTLFLVKKTQKKIVTCHNSFCQMKHSKERTVETFLQSASLCSHLQRLRSSVDVSMLSFSVDNMEIEAVEDEHADVMDGDDDGQQVPNQSDVSMLYRMIDALGYFRGEKGTQLLIEQSN